MRRPNRVVKYLRNELGLTQRAFAAKAKINHVYVCQIETGTYAIGGDAGMKILKAFRPEMEELDVTLEDVLRGSFKPARPAA